MPQLTSNDQLMFVGSCFSDHISEKLIQDHMKVCSNPFGILFHPSAILKVIDRSINEITYGKEDFFEWDNYWFCHEHHGGLAERDHENYLKKSNGLLQITKEQLISANVLFITLGSAWGYVKNNQVVGNCHQQDSQLFSKEIMKVSVVVKEYQTMIKQLRSRNSKLKIVFTVSPVRHFKDGLVENQRSKSLLNAFCHEMTERENEVYYFPSYEYVIDCLRDYSFFKMDTVHLNEKAIDTCYDFFKKHFFSPSLTKMITDWTPLKKSLNHRSKRRYSQSNLKFKVALLKQLKVFSTEHKICCKKEQEELQLHINEIRQEI